MLHIRFWAENLALLLLLALSPLIVAAGNTDWLFNHVGWIDPWPYVGFYLHYDIPNLLTDEKKIARLPWILTGFAAYKTLGPVAANYALHWLWLVGSPILTYLIVLRLFARWIAFATAALMLWFIPLHGPGGWDWNGGGSGITYLATFLLVTRAAQAQRPLGWMAGASVAFAVMVHTDVLLVFIAPLLALQYVMLRGELRLADILRWIALLSASLIIVTAALGLINFAYGRTFWFSSILFARIGDFLAHPAEQTWWRPWSDDWILDREGQSLALPMSVVAVAAITLLARWRTLRLTDPAVSLLVQLLLAAAVLVLWQSLGQPVLQPWYMAVPIVYPTFLALAALLHLWSAPVPWLLILPMPVIAAIYLRHIMDWHPQFMFWTYLEPSIITFEHAALVLIALNLAAFALLAFGRWSVPRAAGLWILLATGILTLHSGQVGAYWVYSEGQGCDTRQRLFRSVVAASEYLAPIKGVRIWWNDATMANPVNTDGRFPCQVSARHIAQPVAVTGIPRIALPWPEMPKLEAVPDDQFNAARVIAVVGSSADRDAARAALLRRTGKEWPEDGSLSLVDDGLEASVYLLLRPQPY